jgi:hypothetical protein
LVIWLAAAPLLLTGCVEKGALVRSVTVPHHVSLWAFCLVGMVATGALRQGAASAVAEDFVVIGQLLRDIPAAGAVAGDRVVFRPTHEHWDRQCVLMHSTRAEHFLGALHDGTLEIIAAPTGVDDPRSQLAHLVQHPPRHLSLLQ